MANSCGYCPKCGAPGQTRERRPNGNTVCKVGHIYPSKDSVQIPKKDKVHNYIDGLNKLREAFDIEDISGDYVKVNCAYDVCRRLRDEMEDIGWELNRAKPFEPLTSLWKFDSGPVMRG